MLTLRPVKEVCGLTDTEKNNHMTEKEYEFEIPIAYTVAADITVRAKSLLEACKKVGEMKLPLPEGEYVEDSFEINDDVLEELNKGVLEVVKVDDVELENLPILIGTLKTSEGKKRLEDRLREEGK